MRFAEAVRERREAVAKGAQSGASAPRSQGVAESVAILKGGHFVIAEEKRMLTLTDTATMVVKEIVDRSGGPDGTGLRINAEDPAGTEFAVEIVPTPEETDAIVEQAGARVYLGGNAAEALADKTLDASVSPDGRVAFDVVPQQA
ncbi:Fe-S cluster assembly iron-binding protein IscA [Agromyces albus]|nr:Fe-S cluster assembly iron-binding protein IscA [Agromyces albus]